MQIPVMMHMPEAWAHKNTWGLVAFVDGRFWLLGVKLKTFTFRVPRRCQTFGTEY